jgi:hypothetical protein
MKTVDVSLLILIVIFLMTAILRFKKRTILKRRKNNV